MATEYRSSVLGRRAARTGKRKARRAGQWLWPLIGPVGLGIAVACGESWADPQVVSPSGLPAQVRPTYPEPGLPAFNFNQGGTTLLGGAGTPGPSGTPGSPGTGTPGSTPAPPGTPIPTFNFNGAYGPPDSPGGASGVSHTGIYLGQDSSGVQILDQWSGSGGASIHTIPWSSWGGSTAEAGSHYYVIK